MLLSHFGVLKEFMQVVIRSCLNKNHLTETKFKKYTAEGKMIITSASTATRVGSDAHGALLKEKRFITDVEYAAE